MRDKNAAGIARRLENKVTRFICTSLAAPRAVPGPVLAEIVANSCPDTPREIADSPEAALEAAWARGETICAAGSTYLVGELMSLLEPTVTTVQTTSGLPR